MDLFKFRTLCFCLILLLQTCFAITQNIRQIYPGFHTSQMVWIEDNGLFLLSNNSVFGFGFHTNPDDDVTMFALVVIHINSSIVVWTANIGSLVTGSDAFVFDNNGNVYLKSNNGVVWSTNTAGETATAIVLQDSGNLVLLGVNGKILWQSFSHPTDTLLLGQQFLEGMQLRSAPNRNNLLQYLEIMSGNLVLYARYGSTPQIYWSIIDDSRKTKTNVSGKVHAASLMSNSWVFYDQWGALLWQFIFTNHSDQLNATWAAVLGSDGSISFYNLQLGKSVTPEAIRIPQSSCSIPEPCDPYYVCYVDRQNQSQCQCPSFLNSQFNCKPQIISTCNGSKSSVELLYVGEKLDYFALGFFKPFLISDVYACKQACLANCSCLVLFFESSSGSCFLFDEIGSLQQAEAGSAGYISYLKVLSNGDGGQSPARVKSRNRRHIDILVIVIIVIATVLVIVGLIFVAFLCHRKSKIILETSQDTLEDNNLLDSLHATPVIRFSYSDLHRATNNFSIKLGEGGFGSVYLGVLSDGTLSAVKQLERIGQGMKEFRAEVSLIGSIHHVHLVQLKGFCAEGTHQLLVYEYMGKGSLDSWIFNNNEGKMLDWDTRFNIAVGTAKGLAYLHEDCEVKIVHCDIKPENVLLDDNYVPKISDFGLAKLMDREQSLVFTQLRGTRGYLAPEWIFNYAISEKSDVYSYGMLLLEIIGGRKNSDPMQSSERAYLPSYAFKMMEEEKIKEILDSKLETYESDQRVATAVKVALWCIQEDIQLRPSMSKVVQMLEGRCVVPQPPTSSMLGSHSSSGKWGSELTTSTSRMIDYNSDAHLSAVRLSGPR